MRAFNLLEELAAVDRKILEAVSVLKTRETVSKGSALKKVRTQIAACEQMREQISATQAGDGALQGR